jgi:hypothetical protein
MPAIEHIESLPQLNKVLSANSRDELTRRMEVDLKEQNARVSSVASCGLGVGLAVSGAL